MKTSTPRKTSLRKFLAAFFPQGEGVFEKPRYTYRAAQAIIETATQRPFQDFRQFVEDNLPAPRYVAVGTAVPPRGNRRLVNELVEETWTPKIATFDSTSIADIARFAGDGPPTAGWVVAQRLRAATCDCDDAIYESSIHGLLHVACGRTAKSAVVGDFLEHVQSITITPADDATYNGFYPSLPGDDVVHYNPGGRQTRDSDGRPMDTISRFQDGIVLRAEDGTPLRGGKEIRGGRREHAELTKDMVHIDAGARAHQERLAKQRKAQEKKELRDFVEREVRKQPRVLGEL